MVSAGALSHPVPLLICVSPYHRDLRRFKTTIRSTGLVSDATCPLINRTVCFTLRSGLSSNWDCLFFSLYSSQDVSSSRGTDGDTTRTR